MPVLSRRRIVRWLLAPSAIAALVSSGAVPIAHAQARRDFTVTATKGAFKVVGSDKAEIRVTLGELVHITFDAQDIPHSFTTVETSPHYRIDRRAEPGKPVSFDFRADQVTTLEIHCTLTLDPKCKDTAMKVVLVVVEPK